MKKQIKFLSIITIMIMISFSGCKKKYSVPTLTTDAPSSITETTATSGGNITVDGGATVTARGVCWGTTTNPTTANSKTTDDSGTGTFTSSLTGLTASTTYYVQAYATNSEGTAYGNEQSFTTTNRSSSGTVTDYDGNTYNTVTIGNQEWMAENLKVTHYTDGTAIPLVTDNTAWGNLGDDDTAYCYNNNNASGEANTYGALYTWAAAMNGASSSTANPSGIQGVCPTGWHLPSDAEWKELEMHLGMSQSEADDLVWRGTNEGSKLAGNEALWDNGNLENNVGFGTSGFSALPGGYRHNLGSFSKVGDKGTWWSTTLHNDTYPWRRNLHRYITEVYRHLERKSFGISVRCTRD